MLNLIVCICVISIRLICCFPSKDNVVNDYYKSGGADLAYLGKSIFGKPDEESGKKLEQWNESSEVNPEELGSYAEGDILFPTDRSRNGVIDKAMRWPQGEVPFEINGNFNNKERELIKNAMIEYHKRTCIRFRRRRPNDSDWIALTSTNTGCWSSVGRTGGKQAVNFQSPGCFGKIGTIIHELLHALGFHHEQSRWERDSFVTINWENIQKGKEGNFQKRSKNTVSGFGVSYDYESVMHYSAKAFSSNGESTITVNNDSKVTIGQRAGFSSKDLEKLRIMYNCAENNKTQNNTDVDLGDNGISGDGIFSELISIFFPQ